MQHKKLDGIRLFCAETTTKPTHVGEHLDSLMVQLEEYTLKCRSIPLQVYINGVDNTIRLPQHTGEREVGLPRQISCVDLDCEIRQHEFQKRNIHRLELLCLQVHMHSTFPLGLDGMIF